jgi:hypothetical protein
MLLCSNKVIRTINERLAKLVDEDIETVMLAMAFMMQHQDLEDGDGIGATDDSLFARTAMGVEQGKCGYPDGFLPAMVTLLNRIGGLECVKDRGLCRSLCSYVMSGRGGSTIRPLILHEQMRFDLSKPEIHTSRLRVLLDFARVSIRARSIRRTTVSRYVLR